MILNRLAAFTVCLMIASPGAALGAPNDKSSGESAKKAPLTSPAAREAIRPVQLLDIRPATSKIACDAFIQDFLDWLAERRTGARAHRVGAKMTSVKIRDRRGEVYPWGHGAYSEGGFGWGGSKLVGRFKTLFSDRRVGVGGNRFAHDKSDIQDVTLHADGRVEIMLRSWGDTMLTLENVTCYRDGFLTGVKREGNGVSLVSFALRKEIATPDTPRGAAAWP